MTKIFSHQQPAIPMTFSVLHVIGTLNRGGAEMFLLDLVKSSSGLPISIFVLCYGDEQFDLEGEMTAAGATVIRVRSARNLVGLFLAIRKLEPDVVHTHTDLNSGLVVAAATLARVPVRATHAHKTEYLTRNAQIGRKLYESTMVRLIRWLTTLRIACGRDAGRALYGGDTFLVQRNGVDLSKFLFNPDSRERIRNNILVPGEAADTLIIGCIARLEPQKNHSFLIQVLNELVHRKVSVRLVLIGRGSEEASLRELADAAGLTNQITFLGVRDDVAVLINALDLAVLPSHFEGFPVSAVEVQLNGLPLLLSDQIDPDVALSPTCKLLPIGCPDAVSIWSDAVEEVICNRVSRTQPTAAALQFDASRTGNEVFEMYQRNLSESIP